MYIVVLSEARRASAGDSAPGEQGAGQCGPPTAGSAARRSCHLRVRARCVLSQALEHVLQVELSIGAPSTYNAAE